MDKKFYMLYDCNKPDKEKCLFLLHSMIISVSVVISILSCNTVEAGL